MPISFKFVDGDYDIHTIFSGQVTLEEMEDYFRQLTAEKDFQESRTELVEFNDADLVDLDYKAMQHFARIVEMFDGNLTATAIVSPSSLPFGISRMYQSAIDNSNRLQVFREVDSAIAWLRQQSGN